MGQVASKCEGQQLMVTLKFTSKRSGRRADTQALVVNPNSTP